MAVRILIVEAYDKAGRKEIGAVGCTVASTLYQRMLKRLLPDIETEIVMPADIGSSLPLGTDLNSFDGIAWTGSSLTIYKDEDRVTRQIDFAREAFRQGVPSFGSCWAIQIAAMAAGGSCRKNPNGREFGIGRRITLTRAGREHPMYFGKRETFDALSSHLDEVATLPPGAQILATNDMTSVQAAQIRHDMGTFWGLQYHPEFDLHEIARLTHCRRRALIEDGFFGSEEAVDNLINRFEALHEDPTRTDIAWAHDIASDVTDPNIRELEVRNWLEHQVLK